jgi:hypothetical protein
VVGIGRVQQAPNIGGNGNLIGGAGAGNGNLSVATRARESISSRRMATSSPQNGGLGIDLVDRDGHRSRRFQEAAETSEFGENVTVTSLAATSTVAAQTS